SGPSVKWVEMHDPQDPQGSYTRYAYWVEDLDGYLDASVVGNNYTAADTDPNKQATYQRANGTPSEVALFTIFNPTLVINDSSTAATTLINNRPLLLPFLLFSSSPRPHRMSPAQI